MMRLRSTPWQATCSGAYMRFASLSFPCDIQLTFSRCRGLWAVVQARHSPIDFDFATYATVRLAAFTLHRAIRSRANGA